MRKHFIFSAVLLLLISFSCGGCNLLLRILQKEVAEEIDLLGNTEEYNPKVEELQTKLKMLGYNPGPVDGKIGFRTRGAVKEFQGEYGLKVTGYVDKRTWAELNRVYEINVLSLEKIDVKQIQTALKNAGFEPGPIDGKLGPRTKRAIKEFQKSKELTPDGVVGYKTWGELRKYLLKKKD